MQKECNDDFFEVYSDQTSSDQTSSDRWVTSTLLKIGRLISTDGRPREGSTAYHEKLIKDGAKVTNVAMYTVTYWKFPLSREKFIADPPTIVVLDTDLGIYVSVGKLQGRSFQIYESETRKSVIHVISKRHPVELVIEDKSDYSFSQLMDNLKREKSDLITTPTLSNQFAKRIFAEVGQSQYDLNDKYFKLSEQQNVANPVLGQNHEHLIDNAKVTNIAVYKTQFDRADTNSPKVFGVTKQGGVSVVENETFVVLKTNCGVFLSVEKKKDGIYIGKSAWFESLVYGMVVEDESHEIELIVEDDSTCCLSSLLDLLNDLENQEHVQCIHDFLIMNRIFNEVSLNQYNVHFKLSSVDNVAEKVFGSEHGKLIENTVVKHIGVYKTPLEALYKSSHSTIKRSFSKQWTAVDYHAFLVLKTNNGIFLSLEKQRDGIYISKSPSYECLVYGLQSSPRNTPVELITEAESKYSLSDLIENLKCEEDEYDPTKNNCQHFAKRHFDRVASLKYWEFERPREYLYKLTSLVLFLILGFVVIYHVPLYIYIYNMLCETPFTLLNIIKYCALCILFIVRYYWIHILRGLFLLTNMYVFFVVILGPETAK